MIDFFAEIHFTSNEVLITNDFFDKQNVYSELTYFNFQTEFNNCKFVWTKRFEEIDSYFENNQYLTLIYGYCFTRLDSNLKIGKKRLTANDLGTLYDEYKERITDHIKGSYSMLIFDKEKNEVRLFTDKFNIKNIYYSFNGSRLLISTSLGAFSQYSKEEFSKVNVKSILEYYLFDFDLVDESFIENIYSLPSASCLTVSLNKIEKKTYWDIFNAFADSKPELDEDEGIAKVEDLLKKNLDLYLNHPQKTAFALTGGYDSRTNLALLDGKADKCFFYSYGLPESYDVKLSQRIARELGLNFKAFHMDDNFAENFDKNAEIAIRLGDGISEMNRANYVYVYKNFFTKFDHILTGLFGSELIKRPTSLGGYIDVHVRDLLLSNNLEECFEKIILKAKSENYFKPEIIDQYKDQILNDIVKNPYLNNKFNGALKFFFFITGIGNCKYFMKEIKTERPFVENLHPYLDIEFVELLMKTPFPWVYNWEEKKSLLENLKIHKFYGSLIYRNNKKLADIITTHAYKPKYLLKKIWLPFLIAQYLYFKKRISKIGIFRNEGLIYEFYTKRKKIFERYTSVFNQKEIEHEYLKHMKDFTKLSSLQIWMHENDLKL